MFQLFGSYFNDKQKTVLKLTAASEPDWRKPLRDQVESPT